MDCQRMQQQWTAYLQEQVSDDERAAIEQHLGTCDACQSLPVIDAGVSQLLRTRLQGPKAPEALRARILDQVQSAAASQAPAASSTPPAQGHSDTGSWFGNLLGSPWAPRLAMAAVIAFVVLVPARTLFRAPALAVETAERYEHHVAAASMQDLGCCKPLAVLPGDRLGDPSQGVTVPNLTEDGLEFVMAGKCDYEGTEVTVLAYRCAGNKPFSLYITDRALENFQAMRTREAGGIRQASHEVRSSEVTIWEKTGLVWFWVGPRAHPNYSPALADLRTL